ncbi:MAG TPA: ferredoxin--NADP(+) reductase [Xanthomonadaceae bacterium]|nr:ferredoxin--NADP(+) reductase [Xanthomonadaceae bacterium]
MIPQFPMRLVAKRMLAPAVVHLSFQRADGQALDYIPGQFIQIHLTGRDGQPTKRSYSLATIHDHAMGPGEAVDIAASYVPGGTATALFEGLQPGDEVTASGPFGRFCLMPGDANRRYLLLATGTGVTPYRSMLPLLETAIVERGVEVVLLFGARSEEELIYADDFRAMAAQHPARFRFVPCYSRVFNEAAGPDARRGHVTGHLAEFAPQPASDIAYLCGNPNMVDAAFEALKAAGLPMPAIRREKYVSSANPKRQST